MSNQAKPKVVAIIQGRMGSSRLPGKILKEITGKPMLVWVVERARTAALVDEVVFATTTDPSDDPVAELCARRGITCSRGNLYDVLDRYYQAAKAAGADVVVRITADCPLIDPGLIDQTVQAFFETGADFAANRLPPPWKRTFPIGLDTEVCSFAALERAWKEAELPHEREHVMPFLYDTPGRFKLHVINHDPDYGDLRWTVDTPQDLDAVRRLFELLPDPLHATWLEVLEAWRTHPELEAINAGVVHHKFNEVDDRFSPQDKKSQ